MAYAKVLAAELSGSADPCIHTDKNGWTLAMLALADGLDGSPPSGGNPVDAVMTKIESTLGTKYRNITDAMREVLNDAHARFARAM